MGYAIAAYALVIGSLVAYGLWLQARRRALMREEREASMRPTSAQREAGGPASR